MDQQFIGSVAASFVTHSTTSGGWSAPATWSASAPPALQTPHSESRPPVSPPSEKSRVPMPFLNAIDTGR